MTQLISIKGMQNFACIAIDMIEADGGEYAASAR